MRPFRFNLQKILDLRIYDEEEAKIELGRATGVLVDLENRIKALAAERARTAASQFDGANSAAMIQQYMYYLLRLDNLKEELLSEAAQAELKVEEAREAYLAASRERKVLDMLKERKQKEHRKEMLLEETKVLDDVPLIKGL
ncbi:MAG: flagellar export protein FliJ [Treponema sp.]|nr:flagellar export protein FliJ [Treponema sp.]